ncbi:MAG: DDE-type integrase/transposase/recombinase [Candidatus Binataceae bacterium]
MNKLSLERRARILGCLCEGVSVRATCRLLDCSKDAVLKLIVDAGTACATYHDEHVRGIKSKRVQVDEIWSFVHAKAKNVPQENRGQFGFGDVWTWTAIDADSKLMVAWHVGRRDAAAAHTFMRDVAGRLANRIQLTSDGNSVYLSAVDEAFARDVDYAMLIKQYGESSEAEKRYSPAICVGAEKSPVRGRPNPEHISTSYVERSNLTLRMQNRRFTRLTNAFSKKLANHKHMLAISWVFYNFARIHQTLRVTPAMEAGISDHVWTLEEIAALVDAK